ncbi:MAG: hypothetical protein JXA13_06125 [Anaerolineales bacterium]|nr:hypothetical protein [Anaerolineales bacterium]
MKQFCLTVSAGKRLIARALSTHPDIKVILESRTLVILAGTTNGYIAEEILNTLGMGGAFNRRKFVRGVTLPPKLPTTETGRLPDESEFPGDVVISKGTWMKGKTIFDVVDTLESGDVILKGANALDAERRQAAILIGHPRGGTIASILQVVLGKRVRLILPVGLEKRIPGDLNAIANRVNAPDSQGLRLWPAPGEVFTEIDAIQTLTGASAELVAAGGVGGAEGCIWLGVEGTREQLQATSELIQSLAKEPPFEI